MKREHICHALCLTFADHNWQQDVRGVRLVVVYL